MDIQDQLDLWSRQAAEAIDAGRPKDKVLALLAEKFKSVGATADFSSFGDSEDPVKNSLEDQASQNRMTLKRAYKNTITPEIIKDINAVDRSPSKAYGTGMFDASHQLARDIPQQEEAPQSFMQGLMGAAQNLLPGGFMLPQAREFNNQVSNSLASVANKAIQGGALIAPTAINAVSPIGIPDELKDYYYQKAQEAGANQQYLPEGTGLGGLVGNVAGGLTMGPLASAAAGADILDRGGDLATAEKVNAITGAANVASIAAGKILPANLAARLATQGILAGGIGEGARLANNAVVPDSVQPDQPFSAGNFALNAGLGLLGGFAKPEAKVSNTKPVVEDTFPKTPDNLVNAGAEAYEAQGTKSIFNYDNDLINAVGNKLPTDAEPRILQDVTKKGPSNLGSTTEATVNVSPLETETLQKYQLGEAEATSGASWADAATVPKDMQVNFPNQEVKLTFDQPSNKWRVVDRTKLPGKKFVYTLDDSGNPQLVESKIAPRTAKAQKASEIAELKQLLNEAKSTEVPASLNLQDKSDLAKLHRVPEEVLSDYQQNKLTTGKYMDAIADNAGGMFSNMPKMRAFAGYISDMLERLGVKDSPVEKYNPEVHTEPMSSNIKAGVAEGYYQFPTKDVQNPGIRLHKEIPAPILVMHEAVHVGTHKAVYLGNQRKLLYTQQKAFDRLNALREELGTHIDEGRTPSSKSPIKYEDGSPRHYGLTNMDEFLAEILSNDRFRSALENIPEPEFASKKGTSASIAKSMVKARYTSIVSDIRELLGMPKQAETALDIMFAATKDFTDSLQPGMAWGSGRRAPSTMKAIATPKVSEAPEVPQELRKGEGGPAQMVRATFGRALPEIQAARERARSGSALGQTLKYQTLNKINSLVKANPDSRQAIMDAIGTIRQDSAAPAAKEAYKTLSSFGKEGKDIADIAMQVTDKSYEIGALQLENADRSDASLRQASSSIKGATGYLPRIYQAFTSKKYGRNVWSNYQQATKLLSEGKELAPHLQEAYKAVEGAKNWLLDTVYPEGSKVFNRDYAAQSALQELLGLRKSEAGSAVRVFRNMMNDPEVLATRENVPKPLRKLWGEETSPAVRLGEAVAKQAAVSSQLQAMKDVREAGLGKFLVDQEGVPGYTHQISGDSYGALNGLWTTPDVGKMVEGFIQSGKFLSDFGRAMLGDPTAAAGLSYLAQKGVAGVRGVMSFRKTMDIVGNLPMAITRNLGGSPVQLMTNGIAISPKHVWNGIKAMSDLINATGREDMGDLAKEVSRLGLVEATQLSETHSISPLAKQALKKLSDAGLAGKGTTLQEGLDAVLGSLKHKGTVIKEIFGAADLWTKFANYSRELEFRMKQAEKQGPLTAEKIEAIKKATAHFINDTNVTPSRAFMAAKVTDAVGATQFMPYFAEILRTTSNNVLYGGRDLQQGIRTGNRELALHGASRLLGTAGAVGYANGLYAIGAKLAAGILGMVASQAGQDEEAKKYLETSDQYKGGEPLILKDKEGNKFVWDAAQFNPVDQVSRPAKFVMQALAAMKDGNSVEAQKNVTTAMESILSQAHSNSVWAYGKKLWDGSQPAWAKDAPELYNKMLSQFRSAGVSDTTADRVLSLYSAVSPKLLLSLTKATGEKSQAGQALVGSGSGAKKLDPLADLVRYGSAMAKSDITTAKNAYLGMLKKNIDTKVEDVEPTFKKGLEDVAKVVDNLQAAVLAAKEQGASRSKIGETLVGSGLSEDMAGELLRAKPRPAILMAGLLDKDLEKDVLTATSKEERDVAVQRYRKGMRVITQLVSKYRDKSSEEIQYGK